MITPNKFTPFDQTVLSKLHIILSKIDRETPITNLFLETESNFNDINEFILTLDVLFVLQCISIDFKEGIIKHAP